MKTNLSGLKKKTERIIKLIYMDCRRIWKIVLAIALYIVILKMIFGSMCPCVILTGLPCPGCGMTRALLSVLTGRFTAAWKYNPNIYLWIVAAAWFFINRYFLERKTPCIKAILTILVIVLVVSYLYRMKYCFQTTPPMTFKYRNILSVYIPGYLGWLRKILPV